MVMGKAGSCHPGFAAKRMRFDSCETVRQAVAEPCVYWHATRKIQFLWGQKGTYRMYTTTVVADVLIVIVAQ
jgi:hypothetical protein